MKTVRCTQCNSEIPVLPDRRLICLNCGLDAGHLQPGSAYQNGCVFCPQCGTPLDSPTDAAHLCSTCGWFGDWQEALPLPPKQEEFNLITSVLQSLEMFRDVCRKEQLMEIFYDRGELAEKDLRQIHETIKSARQALVTMFTALRRRIPQVLIPENGVVSWPEDWTDRHYNSQDPCDTLVGPCICGAYHTEKEGWVQSTLQHHDAIILQP